MEQISFPLAYGCKHKNTDIRLASRSGGVFTAVSDLVLEQDGAVYGCVLNEKLEAVHIRAEDKVTRDRMRGSKYVQSRMGDTFSRVREDLQAGKPVLFSGTPCQVDGLKKFLSVMKTDTALLLTLDLVCHGVPSPRLWRDYLHYQEKQCGGAVTAADFRDKRTFGWKARTETLTVNSNRVSSELYAKLYYTDYALRRSCYECAYTSKQRVSDLTLADFWGIDKLDNAFNDNRGVSLILVNTPKGKAYFDSAADALEVRQYSIDDVDQRSLNEPFYYNSRRESFWKDYRENGFDSIIKKYAVGNPLMPLIEKVASRFI